VRRLVNCAAVQFILSSRSAGSKGRRLCKPKLAAALAPRRNPSAPAILRGLSICLPANQDIIDARRESALFTGSNKSAEGLLHFCTPFRGSAIGSTPAFGAGYPGSSPGPGANLSYFFHTDIEEFLWRKRARLH
jgi:hypothetical protein